MDLDERLSKWTVMDFLNKVADVSEAIGFQANTGGMETAGMIVSYLAEHPYDIEPFMNGGYFELPAMPHRHGCLTWHGQDGKIYAPEFARRQAIINKMKPAHD